MTCIGILALIKENAAAILAMLLVFEQYLAANRKIKANSTSQLIINLAKAALSPQSKNDGI